MTHGIRSSRGLKMILAIALVLAMFVPSAALANGKVTPAKAGKTVGAVYVMTNETTNKVIVFHRDSKGTLTRKGAFATGGAGTGAGLGTQGALARSVDGKWLFAVNAGSDEISVMSIRKNSLVLVNKVSSVGTMPVSLTVGGGVLYCLNGGGSGSIAGFRVSTTGHLSFMPASVQPLSNMGTGTAPVAEEILLKPWGGTLVVTEKSTNKIDVYGLTSGIAGPPMVFDSSGAGPYGCDFTRTGVLVVSEAAANAVSSYIVWPTMHITISPSVEDSGMAPCWLKLSPNNKFAYVSDAHSDNLSTYRVWPDGVLTLLKSPSASVSTPLDLDLTRDGRFVYVLAKGTADIRGFKASTSTGLLSGSISSSTIPSSCTGLVAW